jgi:hypothetical protein
MTTPELTALLAQRVMRWTVHLGRYQMENRRWTPAWRFQPTKNLEDAFRLLEAADPDDYSINSHRGGTVTVRVQISGTTGEASDTTKARAITHAIARAIGLDPEDRNDPKTGQERR